MTTRNGTTTTKRRGSAARKPKSSARSTAKADKGAKLSAFDATRFLDSDKAVAEFIDAALETGEPSVLIRALGEVARAQGMAKVAKRSGLGRESLYKALQPASHPRLATIMRVAQALGIRLHASAA
jgi:probable addiction module antidote protein